MMLLLVMLLLRLGARDGDGGDRSGAPAATGPNAEAPG